MKLEDTIGVIGKLTKSEKRSISMTLNRMSKSDDPSEQHFRLYNLLLSIVKDSEKAKNLKNIAGGNKRIRQKKYIDTSIKKAKEEHPRLFTSLNIIRLYDFILSTLRSLNVDRSLFKLSNYLQEIQILMDKRLFQQAVSLCEKAKKEAREEDTATGDLVYLHFLFLERKIHLTVANDRDQKTLEGLEKESKNQYRRISYIIDAALDQGLLHRYVHAGEKIPNEVIDNASDTFKRILEKPEASTDMALDVALAELFCTVLYLRSKEAPHEKVLPQLKQMNALFDEDKISRHPGLYHSSKMVLINDGIKNGLGELVQENIHYIFKAIGLDPELPVEDQIKKIVIDKHTPRNYYNHIFIIIAYTIGTRKFAVASKIISHIKNLIEEYQPPQGHLLALYWQFATVHFLLQEFKSAKDYVDKIIALKSGKGRKDVVFNAELLDALLGYEMNTEKSKNASLRKKIIKSLETLEELEQSEEMSKYDQNKIRSATNLLSKLLDLSGSGEKFTKAQLQDLYKIQTKGMGDFITDVFALWTQQKIQSLS